MWAPVSPQDEFFVALKLIALTQAGIEPVLENITLHADHPHLIPHTADALVSSVGLPLPICVMRPR